MMYGYKSTQQVQYEPKDSSTAFRAPYSRENVQVKGLALTAHHDTQNKSLIELLSAQGFCIQYSRVLRLETAIANVENSKLTGGLYVPPFMKKGDFPFFAADNAD